MAEKEKEVTQPDKAADKVVEETEVEETKEELEGEVDTFDPSSIDVNDRDKLAGLTDEQFKAVTEFQALPPEEQEKIKAAVASPAPGPEGETQDKDTEAKPEGETASPAEQQKLAGKYATPEELVKGVEQLSERLGYKDSPLKVTLDLAIESAKSAKKYDTLETLYKQMEGELGKRAAQPSPTPVAAPEKDTQSDTVAPDDKDFAQKVSALAFDRVVTSPLARQMNAAGLELPKTPEEFTALQDASPYYAIKFENAFTSAYETIVKEAGEHSSILKSKEASDKAVIDSDIQALKDFATANELPLTDQELETIRAGAIASPMSYDVKAGVRLLRQDAVKDYFYSRILPAKLNGLKLAATTRGRMEATEDQDILHKKAVRSIGTSKLNTTGRAKAKEIDVNNPEQVAGLPDDHPWMR